MLNNLQITVSKRGLISQDGIVYLLFMWIDDFRVVKIGITTRQIEERVVEILTSYYHKYRVFPKLYPKRFRKTTGILDKEAMLHKYFADKQHVFEQRFDGSSEYFVIDDDEELLQVYEDCLMGVDINSNEYKYLREQEKMCRSRDTGSRVGIPDGDGTTEMGIHEFGVDDKVDAEIEIDQEN